MVSSSPSNQISDNVFKQTHVSWWLAALGQFVFWALLREKEAGAAEVLDHNGQTLMYESLDRARAALLEAQYREFYGLDGADAAEWGLSLAHISPPQCENGLPLPGTMQLQRPNKHSP